MWGARRGLPEKAAQKLGLEVPLGVCKVDSGQGSRGDDLLGKEKGRLEYRRDGSGLQVGVA